MSTRNRFPVPKTAEERAEFVATHFDPRAQTIPDNIRQLIRQLREDFRTLKHGETIHDCRTWEAFCKRVLHRTTRAVLYVMKGGNPRCKRKAPQRNGSQPDDSSSPDDSDDGFDPAEHWGGQPECRNDDQQPVRTLYVHFASEADVEAFAELVNQRITPKAKSIWFPAAKIGSYKGKAYVAQPEAAVA